MTLAEIGAALLDSYEGPDEAAAVTCDINTILLLLEIHRDELLDAAALSKESEVPHEL